MGGKREKGYDSYWFIASNNHSNEPNQQSTALSI